MTVSEDLFEYFCSAHGLEWTRLGEGDLPTPEYVVRLGGVDTVVEVKQIDQDASFSTHRSSRTLGDHVREKIKGARNQVRVAGAKGVPAILLIYNNLDPLQEFGTGLRDLHAAMYGEPTVALSVDTRAIVDSFYGRNKSLRRGKNESFSAVGHLKRATGPPPFTFATTSTPRFRGPSTVCRHVSHTHASMARLMATSNPASNFWSGVELP